MENIFLFTILIFTLLYLVWRIKKNLIDGEPGEHCAHCGKLQLKKHLWLKNKRTQ
jgi:hypothetical protein